MPASVERCRSEQRRFPLRQATVGILFGPRVSASHRNAEIRCAERPAAAENRIADEWPVWERANQVTMPASYRSLADEFRTCIGEELPAPWKLGNE